jgi:hypothetical protein
MGHSHCLQPRVTVSCVANNAVIQNEPLWGDFEIYQDAAFYLDVSGLSPQAGSSLQPVLNIQSSPSKDPGNFSALSSVASWTFAGTPALGLQQIRYVPFSGGLCRYVRWQLNTVAMGATLMTLQIWVTLNPGPR